MHFSRHINGDTTFRVIVAFLKKTFQGFSKIRDGRVKTGHQIWISGDFEGLFSQET